MGETERGLVSEKPARQKTRLITQTSNASEGWDNPRLVQGTPVPKTRQDRGVQGSWVAPRTVCPETVLATTHLLTAPNPLVGHRTTYLVYGVPTW